MRKGLTYYRALPYARRCQLFVDGADRYWHAWIDELPGCEIDGPTKAAAFAALEEVFEDYIKAKLEWRSIIPEPSRWPKLSKAAARKHRSATVRLIKPAAPPSPGTSNQRVLDLERTAETLVPA